MFLVILRSSSSALCTFGVQPSYEIWKGVGVGVLAEAVVLFVLTVGVAMSSVGVMVERVFARKMELG